MNNNNVQSFPAAVSQVLTTGMAVKLNTAGGGSALIKVSAHASLTTPGTIANCHTDGAFVTGTAAYGKGSVILLEGASAANDVVRALIL